jgi:outer membrane biosynthesis protein TonB
MRNIFLTFISIFLLLCFIEAIRPQTNASNNQTQGDIDQIYKQSEVDIPAKILKQTYAKGAYKCSDSTGLARVVVVFHKSGKINIVKMSVPSNCSYFNKQVENVIKKIEFKPAIKNGKPVSQTQTLEYKWTNY